MFVEYLFHRIRLTSHWIRSDDQMTHVYSKGGTKVSPDNRNVGSTGGIAYYTTKKAVVVVESQSMCHCRGYPA